MPPSSDAVDPAKAAKHAAEQRLVEHIYAAFAHAPRPLLDEIVSHNCSECFDIRDQFAKYSVRDVPDDVIDEYNAGLTLMAPIAFRYFLPRYMAFSIVPVPEDSFSADVVLYQLSAPSPDEDYWVSRYTPLMFEERRAIADYIATRWTWPDAEYELEHLDQAERIWGSGTPFV
jgi:hypothetical protein